jgi:hypothetical protein
MTHILFHVSSNEHRLWGIPSREHVDEPTRPNALGPVPFLRVVHKSRQTYGHARCHYYPAQYSID